MASLVVFIRAETWRKFPPRCLGTTTVPSQVTSDTEGCEQISADGCMV